MTDTIIPIDEYENRRSGRSKSNRKPVSRERLKGIMGREFAPVQWAVEGYVPEGFSVLAGRQKLGKTWLALDLGIAIGTGGYAIGSIPCQQGDVLYFDLENGQRRIKSRVAALVPDREQWPTLDRIEFAGECPPVNDGLIPELENWFRSATNPRLIVIDVLQRIKPAGKPGQNSYENDYSIWQELQRWATTKGVAVLGLHHTRKGGADDPLEALSGSNGLSAVADTTLVLDKDNNGTTLYVRGRDVDEKETALKFDAGLWSILGEAGDIRRTGERSQILAVLEDADEPMTAVDLVAATGMKRNNINQLLFKMSKSGEVEKAGKGIYVYPR